MPVTCIAEPTYLNSFILSLSLGLSCSLFFHRLVGFSLYMHIHMDMYHREYLMAFNSLGILKKCVHSMLHHLFQAPHHFTTIKFWPLTFYKTMLDEHNVISINRDLVMTCISFKWEGFLSSNFMFIEVFFSHYANIGNWGGNLCVTLLANIWALTYTSYLLFI